MKEFIRSQWTKAMRSIAAAEATLDPDPDQRHRGRTMRPFMG